MGKKSIKKISRSKTFDRAIRGGSRLVFKRQLRGTSSVAERQWGGKENRRNIIRKPPPGPDIKTSGNTVGVGGEKGLGWETEKKVSCFQPIWGGDLNQSQKTAHGQSWGQLKEIEIVKIW